MKNLFKSIQKSIKYWFLPFLVGALFIALGIYAIASPLLSYLTLAVLFSLSFLFSGLSEIIFAIANRKELDSWGWTLSFGLLTTIIGVLLLIHPELSLVTLPFYVGFLVLFRSVAAIGFSIDLKYYGILDWGNLMLTGVLGLIFSFILLWNPLFAGMTAVLWTGLAIIASGIFSIYFSLKLRKLESASASS